MFTFLDSKLLAFCLHDASLFLVVGSWGGEICRHCLFYIGFYCTVFIALLNLVVNDVLYSLSDLIDFMFLVYIFHISVYAICCFNLCIWIALVYWVCIGGLMC